jgi:glutamate/tyrosine decarboxylase-like PLP-dependent enzyme
MRDLFSEPLPEAGFDDRETIRLLGSIGDQGLMQMRHPRFFGWVLGASHPVGIAADWLATAWGQNSAYGASPTTTALEEVAASWILELLDLPRKATVGFASGATVGNFVALAAARGATLRKHKWDPDADGLFGAPEVHVFIGDDAHTSVFSALQYIGFGHDRVIRVETDSQGRMKSDDLELKVRDRSGPMIIIAQAGQINTGAFDPFTEIANIAKSAGAWLHVDGAFGLWARANPRLKALTEGIEQADSWVTDGHKWLQTPFDTGYAIVRDADAHKRAMTIWASYLPMQQEDDRIPSSLVPELSRRARGVATWAIVKSLGRKGVAEMVGRHCEVARRMAARLATEKDVHVLNEVVLNQVIVEFGAADESLESRREQTQAVIDTVVNSGTCFVGGARWRDRWVMRISVISQNTSVEDGNIAVDAMIEAWRQVRGSSSVG